MESSLWNWLSQSDGEAALTQAAQSLQQGDNELRILTGLRRSYGPNKAAAALQQAQLRRKAIEKFSAAPRMFFTPRGLAQATGEVIARYKAARMADLQVADLCCGIGGDLMAIALRGSAWGVDPDSEAAFCATHNCRAIGAKDVRVVCDTAERVELDPAAAIHLDPDRRPSEKRTVELQFFRPSIADIEAILRQSSAVSLKLAPATRVPERWSREYEIEWVGHRGECKQQIVWTGRMATWLGRRVATVISSNGAAHEQLVETSSRGGSLTIAPLAQYLIEPHPAVLAANLAAELSEQVQAHPFSAEVAYLTAAQPLLSTLASCFEVIESLPLKSSIVEQSMHEISGTIIEVKTRGLRGIDLAGFTHLKPHGPSPFTLVLTRVAGQPRALVCRRCAG